MDKGKKTRGGSRIRYNFNRRGAADRVQIGITDDGHYTQLQMFLDCR